MNDRSFKIIELAWLATLAVTVGLLIATFCTNWTISSYFFAGAILTGIVSFFLGGEFRRKLRLRSRDQFRNTSDSFRGRH